MKCKDELEEIDITYCMCCYFHNIINGTKINLSTILLDKKLYENISVYYILSKMSKIIVYQVQKKQMDLLFIYFLFIYFLMINLNI